jgi:hypothetical protein
MNEHVRVRHGTKQDKDLGAGWMEFSGYHFFVGNFWFLVLFLLFVSTSKRCCSLQERTRLIRGIKLRHIRAEARTSERLYRDCWPAEGKKMTKETASARGPIGQLARLSILCYCLVSNSVDTYLTSRLFPFLYVWTDDWENEQKGAKRRTEKMKKMLPLKSPFPQRRDGEQRSIVESWHIGIERKQQ